MVLPHGLSGDALLTGVARPLLLGRVSGRGSPRLPGSLGSTPVLSSTTSPRGMLLDQDSSSFIGLLVLYRLSQRYYKLRTISVPMQTMHYLSADANYALSQCRCKLCTISVPMQTMHYLSADANYALSQCQTGNRYPAH